MTNLWMKGRSDLHFRISTPRSKATVPIDSRVPDTLGVNFGMQDEWGKLCLLIDMFPDMDFEEILNIFQESDRDLDLVTSIIIQNQTPRNAFDHLVATFPNLEPEAIEAFLVANEPVPQEIAELESLLMVSLNKSVKPKERPLKMNLTEFVKVFGDNRTAWPSSNLKGPTCPISSPYFTFSCKRCYCRQWAG